MENITSRKYYEEGEKALAEKGINLGIEIPQHLLDEQQEWEDSLTPCELALFKLRMAVWKELMYEDIMYGRGFTLYKEGE